jgi:CysZ protein
LGFFRGMTALVGGFAWIARTPGVWFRAAAPAATAFVLFAVFAFLGIKVVVSSAHRTLGAGLGVSFLSFLAGAVAVVLALLLAVSLAQPLSGWALAGIVRAQERALGIAPSAESGLVAGALHSFASALVALAVGVPTIVLLTVIAFVFPPAATVTVPLKVIVAATLLTWDLLDYPLAERGFGIRARLRWCLHNPGAVLGFGLPALLLFAIPGLGLLALPCGVAGAVRLVADRPPPRLASGPRS